MTLQKPKKITKYAEACLHALSAEGFGAKISLGGAFALAYFYEYRETHDVGAWWEPATTSQERRSILQCLQSTLAAFGEVRSRGWGDVSSVELVRQDRTVFSFQIASRDARLKPPQPAPWPAGFSIDAFEDLVASKMAALVERGAPRDFRDIHALCAVGRTDPRSCWDCWRTRQQMAGADASASRARLAVATHLARIEAHRPLDGIGDLEARAQARDVRLWIREEFLDALVD